MNDDTVYVNLKNDLKLKSVHFRKDDKQLDDIFTKLRAEFENSRKN